MKLHTQNFITYLIRLAAVISATAVNATGQYSIKSDSIDCGGGQNESVSYSMTSSVGGIGGQSTSVTPDVTARYGYMGQLYEIESVDISASPDAVDEGLSSELSAIVNLDDRTIILPENTAVQWSKVSGPVDPPSSSGSVTAQAVYENAFATLGGSFEGAFGTTLLAVLNSKQDNYSSYGSDDIDDDWQVNYFGEPPNPDAGPSSNPDGDANDNWMEFLTGFSPVDPNQWFQLTIADKTGSVATLQLNKVIPGRIYTVQAGTDLKSFPDTITTLNPSEDELDKVVTDTTATEQKKFYRVDVTVP